MHWREHPFSSSRLIALFSLMLWGAPGLAAVDGIRIDEIGFSCAGGSTAFVELTATAPGQLYEPGLFLGVTNSIGDSATYTLAFGAAAGSQWPEGGTWLMAGSQFTARTGVSRDGPLGFLDVSGGAMTLFRLVAGDEVEVLDRFEWGLSPGLPRAPYRGQSLQRVSGGFTVQASPTPRPRAGAGPPACYGYSPSTGWRIDEFLVDCADGMDGIQYVQLTASADGRYDPLLRLRLRRADGSTLIQPTPFASAAGQSVLEGTRFLCASSGFAPATGLAADFGLIAPLDPAGGTIELLMPNAGGDSLFTVDRVDYGSAIGVPRPRPGYATRRYADGDLREVLPAPTNRFGGIVGPAGCFARFAIGEAWRIQEFGLGCRVPAADAWFVELKSLVDAQPADARIGLRIRDAHGVILLDRTSLLAGQAREFSMGQTFLLAASGLATAAGFEPDATSPVPLDASAGTLELYLAGSAGPDSILQALAYGQGGLAAPPPGGSLDADATGAFTPRSLATPVNSYGAGPTSECFSGQTRDGLRIAEFAVACADGRPGTWFVELFCVTPETFLESRMSLSWFSRSDSLIATLPASPGHRLGQRLLLGNRLLLGPSTLASLGAVPDHTLHALPDSLAGRVVLSRLTPAGTTQVLSEVRYGGPAGALPPGASLLRVDDSTHVVEPRPTPQNSAGAIANQAGCFVMRMSSAISIRQLATRCRSGVPASFVEMLSEQSQRSPLDLEFVIEDTSGAEIASFDPFSGFEIRALPAGARILLGSSGFDSLGGVARDRALPIELAFRGGAIALYQTSGSPPTRRLMQRLSYGTPDAPAPGSGQSLVRGANGTIALDDRPRMQNLAGQHDSNGCWSPIDSTVRIAELGLSCFLGTFDLKFIEFRSLDPTARLRSELRLRLIDGLGSEIEERGLVDPALVDRPWGPDGRLLAATPGFSAAAGLTPDVLLGAGPARDSGEVQLLWRSAHAPEGIVLDAWRYGFTGEVAAPIPGGGLMRLPSGALATTLSTTPRTLAGNTATGPCFTYLPPSSMLVQQLGLQCSNGTVGAQFIELRSIGALRLDPGIGLEIFDASGVRLSDDRNLFADRAWQYVPAGTSFLLGRATSEADAPPDRFLTAPLDTSGGSLRLYHVGPDGSTRTLGHWNYGETATGIVRPPPGLALERDNNGRLFVVESRPRRFPDIAWALPECHRSIAPALTISEMSLGCPFEPLDGRGRFIELTNLTGAPFSLEGFQLEHGRNELLETVPLRDASSGAQVPPGGHWLIAGSGFESANGVRPDATTLTPAYVPDRYWRARLLWRSHPRYSLMVISRLSIALFLDGRLYPEVPFGSSLERVAGDSLRIASRPTPRNSIGGELPASSSCLGASRPGSPVSIAQFSPGCLGCGPESAFLELTYPVGDGTENVRIRIRNRDGSLRSEIPSPWGTPGQPAPGSSPNYYAPYRWLLGAPGFADSVGYMPQIELPFSLDPAGGTVTVYEPGAPERIHVDLPYGTLEPNGGMRRESPDARDLWPQRYFPVTQVHPENRTRDYSWSRYGEVLAHEVRVVAAGAACGSGDETLRYVNLLTSYYSYCHHGSCFIDPYPPRAGRVRTLDAHGAPLDSAEFGPHVSMPTRRAYPYPWGYQGTTFPTFASGAVLATLGLDPLQVAPRMDSRGGAVQFVMLDPSGRALRTVHSVEYAAVSTQPEGPTPFFGGWPSNFPAQPPLPPPVCPPCGWHSRRLVGESHSTAVHMDTSVTLASGAVRRVYVDGSTGRSGVRLQGYDATRFAEFTSTLFEWSAGASLATARIRARLAVTGIVRMRRSSQAQFQLVAIADADHGLGSVREWDSSPTRDTVVFVADTLDLVIPVHNHRPFRLTQRWTSGLSHQIEALELDAEWIFDQLPEGTRVTSCHGYGGGPVSAALANVSASAFPRHVELLWSGADPGERVRLERAIEASAWGDAAVLDADHEGRIRHIDADVIAGQRLAYRLRRGDGTATLPVEVRIPLEVGLGLRVLGGQPARGAITFEVSRVPGRDARLELFDVAGRRVISAPVSASGASPLRVSFGRSTIASGIYLARLSSGSERAECRLVVAP